MINVNEVPGLAVLNKILYTGNTTKKLGQPRMMNWYGLNKVVIEEM